MPNGIIEAARKARQEWKNPPDESAGDKQAAAVTKAWQDSVRDRCCRLQDRYGIRDESLWQESTPRVLQGHFQN
ncbi:MAG: hypothetical protein Q8P00_03060, partial [Dehalococcoidia bacterium]|nr:hypothetical protein [Dehalococcoidia bacterium]